MESLSNISTWKRKFGLLPIQLKPLVNDNSYVMLNGGVGDFCIQTLSDDKPIEEYYSKSWSSNTKNFVVLDKEDIKIYNWLKNEPEVISQSNVAGHFNKFYDYLLSKSYKSESDVVPFIIDVFRQFRNITFEKKNPIEALNLLFVLLTSLDSDYKNLDYKKWNLKNTNIPPNFDEYTDKIRNGIRGIKPELDLIIRHSSGALFQEAQKEVLFFDEQIDLFGGASNKIITKGNVYSSIHYTPPYLSRTIVENSLRVLDLKSPELKIFDPACGSSEFLIESLKQLKQLNYSGRIKIVGWDSSETAVNTSNFLLKYEQRTIWKENLEFDIKLVEDSLDEKWDDDYNLILMNPPFVSWELLKNEKSKELVRETLKNTFNSKPNQASAFFYKSVMHLGENGVIGCVLPSSILTSDLYKKLRDEVYENTSLNLIGKLGNFVFEDALADISLIVGRKIKNNSVPTVLWTKNEKGVAKESLRELRKAYYLNELTVDKKDYSIYQPSIFPIINDSWKPISFKEEKFLKLAERYIIENRLVRVEQLFSVQPGIRKGLQNVFEISTEKLKELPKNEQSFFRPIINNNSVRNGEIVIKEHIWFPYNSSGILLKTEDDLKKYSKIFYSKFLKPKEYSLKKRVGIKEWWSLARPRNWQYEKVPKLVSTEFGNSDSFGFDESGNSVVERGYAWTPNNEFEDINYYYFYLSIFSSDLLDVLLSIYSTRELAGGKWYDLGKKHTNRIPIPNVFTEEVNTSMGYAELVEIGKQLSVGNSYAKQNINKILFKYFYPEIETHIKIG